MKEYKNKEIKEGMQLRCTDNGGWEHWTVGKNYTVFKNTMGLLVIQSDTGRQRNVTDIVQYLNGVAKAKFELLNEEDNKNMYTVGDLVKINDDLQEGCEYKVYCNDDMETYRGKKAVIVDVHTDKTLWDNERKIYKLQDMNGETIEWSFTDDMFKFTENTTEPPFKVGDKVRVLNNATLASKANGNFYKTGDIDVVGYVECYKHTKGGRIRLGTHGSANWIHFDMIELVEEANKEANNYINKVSDLLQAKIDELTTQAEHLFKKRDRLDEHAKNLNAKARRLEEVRDELNKFK